LVSKSVANEITDRLWEDYRALIARDVSEVEVEYLFVDAVFEALRRQTMIVVSWSSTSTGRLSIKQRGTGDQRRGAAPARTARPAAPRPLLLMHLPPSASISATSTSTLPGSCAVCAAVRAANTADYWTLSAAWSARSASSRPPHATPHQSHGWTPRHAGEYE
jgi:hypothetical protein